MQHLELPTQVIKQLFQKSKALVPNTGQVILSLDYFLFNYDKENNFISVSSSKLDSEINCRYNLESEFTNTNSFSVLVPKEKIVELLSVIDDNTVNIFVDSSQLKIKSKQGNYKVSVISSEDFPKARLENISQAEFNCNYGKLQHILSKVSFASASEKDDLTNVLSNIYFELSKEMLKVTCTDAHILAHGKYNINCSSEQSHTVDNTTFSKVLGLNLSNPDADVSVKFYENYVNVNIIDGNYQYDYIVRLSHNNFVNYEAVIPTNSIESILVRKSIINTLKRVGLFANKHTNCIAVVYNKDNIVIKAEDVELNKEAQEIILSDDSNYVIKNNFPEETVGYNFKNLSDILNKMSTDFVTITQVSKNKATKIVDSDSIGEYVYLVMPIMLN